MATNIKVVNLWSKTTTMLKETTQNANGTSFHNTTIYTNVGKLKELFPNSYSESNDGADKSNYDFVLENDNGDVITIYDWKEYRPIDDDEKIEFHIGGMNVRITENAKKDLLEMI